MESIKKLPYEESLLENGEIVKGYDGWNKKFVKVQYRADSNRFFSYPYTGATWPTDRMHRFRRIE